MIIMKLVSLQILRILLNGEKLSAIEIAKKLKVNPSSTSRALNELRGKNLIEQNRGVITLNSSPLLDSLKAAAGKYRLEGILQERRERIILELEVPKNVNELSKGLGISEVQVQRLIKGLKGMGAVHETEGKLKLESSLISLAIELKKAIESKAVEPNAIVIYSNGFKIKKIPSGQDAKGTLTGFSRFPEFGIDYMTVSDYYAEPEKELSIEEIFVHALKSCENRKDIAMCLAFYIKNKNAMDFRKLVDLTGSIGALPLFLDCIAYLGRREIVQKELFLPWNEFQSIVQAYGLGKHASRKFTKEELEALLAEISSKITQPLKVYLIGGCNMALQGIKGTKKDIDIVVKSRKEFAEVLAALETVGFREMGENISPEYKRMFPSTIVEMEGKPRVDIFTGIVCNAMALSSRMMEKSIEKKYGNLSVNFVRPEDIILFKAITGREGDFDDIAAIIRGLETDWTSFIDELEWQQEQSKTLFCLDVLSALELIEEKEKIAIPIKQKLVKFCLQQSILFLAKKPLTISEIKEKIDFPEPAIRNTIVRLAKQGKIRKLAGKPFRVEAV